MNDADDEIAETKYLKEKYEINLKWKKKRDKTYRVMFNFIFQSALYQSTFFRFIFLDFFY